MEHVSALAAPGTLLFRDWIEAAELWRRVTTALPDRILGLMPDHLHGRLRSERDRVLFGHVLRGYAQWRNKRRGERGPVFGGVSSTPIRSRSLAERTTRYIHLNPCRAGLVADPLAYAFTTHRDAVGLAIPPLCRVVAEPVRFHAWVSGDPSAHPGGTPLPPLHGRERAAFAEVVAAVSALTRTPAPGLRAPGLARDLLIHAARALTAATVGEIADFLGVHRATVRRSNGARDPGVGVVARVVGDPRFALLTGEDLRQRPEWAAYRRLR